MAVVQLPLESRLSAYLSGKAAARKIPINGTFELTPLCNMACRMCYVRMTKQQQEAVAPLQSAQRWLDLASAARDRGMLYLLLTGGEPFLRQDLPELMAALQAMGLVISINTNGTLITPETVDWLRKTPPSRINVTLYGASDETYDRLCGNPQGFTQASQAIDLLLEAGMAVKLNCSITPHNQQDLEGILSFARSRNLPVQATSYMFPPLRRDSSMIGKNHRFSPEEAAYHTARIQLGLLGREEFIRRVKEEKPESLWEDSECPIIEEQGEGIRCRAGKSSFWVTWEGKMIPCGMFPMEDAPNVFEAGFDAAWNRTVKAAEAIRLPAKCAGCPQKDLCRTCAAMVYTETGGFSAVPEYRCRMSGAFSSQRQLLCRQIAETGGSL